jgi:hypothetical protein
MPVSMNNTQVVFNDATTQTTAPVNTNANVNSVTLTGGTAISITSATTTGAAAATINNTGVTSVTAGTGISVSASTGGVTITNTSSASGTVTSVATCNGLSGGTITTSGTLAIAAPTAGSVGSYAFVFVYANLSYGGSFSGGSASDLTRNYVNGCPSFYAIQWRGIGQSLSETWRFLNYGSGTLEYYGLAVRIS